jgi:hypothetical protein
MQARLPHSPPRTTHTAPPPPHAHLRDVLAAVGRVHVLPALRADQQVTVARQAEVWRQLVVHLVDAGHLRKGGGRGGAEAKGAARVPQPALRLLGASEERLVAFGHTGDGQHQGPGCC